MKLSDLIARVFGAKAAGGKEQGREHQYFDLKGSEAQQKAIDALSTKERIIIVGESTVQTTHRYRSEREIADALTEADRFDVEAWFLSEHQKYLEAISSEPDMEKILEELKGTWPAHTVPGDRMLITHDYKTGSAHNMVKALSIKAKDNAELFATLEFGGWNDCPYPDVQTAVWQYWENKYGAKVIAAGGDTIEAYIERPPTTQEDAMTLALEHYLFCSDVVDQGVGSLSELAGSLIDGQFWFFWWD